MKRKILAWSLFGLLILIAVGVMLYPLISTYVNEKNQAIIRSEYLGDVATADSTELQETWNAAAEYNALHKPIRYSNAAVSEASSDYEDLLNFKGNGVMGYVEVPKINVYLPIYHGTEPHWSAASGICWDRPSRWAVRAPTASSPVIPG